MENPILLICSAILNAQDRGTITGSVVDSSGAIVPTARVILTNPATGQRTTVETNSEGTGDRLDFSAVTVGVTVDLSLGVDQTIYAGRTLKFAANTIEHLTGGSANDTLKGSSAINRLEGGPGNDVLEGRAGNDIYVFSVATTTGDEEQDCPLLEAGLTIGTSLILLLRFHFFADTLRVN